MQLTLADTDRLFHRIDEAMIPYDQGIASQLAALRPQSDPSDIGWRYALKGFVSFGVAAAFLPAFLLEEIDELLFNRPGDKNRPGRSRSFLVLVAATRPGDGEVVHEFQVAAENPTDAYAQLAKRVGFRSIPDITSVAVYPQRPNGEVDFETSAQRVFDGDDLINITLQ